MCLTLASRGASRGRLSDIKKAYRTDSGKEVIDKVASGGKSVTIRSGGEGQMRTTGGDGIRDPNKGGESIISIPAKMGKLRYGDFNGPLANDKRKNWEKVSNGLPMTSLSKVEGKVEFDNPDAHLLHELDHAQRNQRGENANVPGDPRPEERKAIKTENKYRREKGYDPRPQLDDGAN